MATSAPPTSQIVRQEKDGKRFRLLRILALSELILGLAVILFSIVTIGVILAHFEFEGDDTLLFGGFISAGVVGIGCGGLGLLAFCCGGQKGLIIGHFVMCLIACMIDFVQFMVWIAVYFGIVQSEESGETDQSWDSQYDESEEESSRAEQGATSDTIDALAFVNVFIVLAHMICTITSMICTCKRGCAGKDAQTPSVVYVQNSAHGQNPSAPSVEIRPFSSGATAPPPQAFGHQPVPHPTPGQHVMPPQPDAISIGCGATYGFQQMPPPPAYPCQQPIPQPSYPYASPPMYP